MAGFRFDISKLRKLQAIIASPSGASQMRPLYERWGIRYLSFARRKFVENSAGGGDWPPLKIRTVYARMLKAKRLHYAKKRGISGRLSILRDTGTLLRGLDVDSAGNLFQPHTFGIKVGYGGSEIHPKSRSASIAEIASFHNTGTDKLPQRRIIWPPDDNVKSFMFRSLKEHINSIGQSL
jgi:hypothetical protein